MARTCWAALVLTANLAHAQVQANGSTATTVTTQAGGRQMITPAAPQRDVSYNAFSRFDVDRNGATFQNAEVRARTIVAEVFSASPSRIEGAITVDGPRANLILANQNGIRVNGGSFVNFGSVALTTGAVKLRDEQLAPGYVQRYVDVSTRGGDIQIEGGGLDGSLIRLELIAKKIGIQGPITNTFTSTTASTRLVVGSSDAQFDTVASPTDNLTPWVYYKAGSDSAPGIAIDLSAGSRISSGRIELVVTDRGAGVRNRGDMVATTGDFRLTSTGDIEQLGGSIKAAGSIRIEGARFVQANEDGRTSTVASSTSTRIDVSGDVSNTGGIISGEVRDLADTDNPYAVLINAGGSLQNRSLAGGSSASIHGGVDGLGLMVKGHVLNSNARIVSNGVFVLHAGDWARNETLYTPGDGRIEWSSSSTFRRNRGYSVELGSLQDADHQAYWAADGGMDIQAKQVDNLGASIFSNQGAVRISATEGVTTRAYSTGAFSYSQSCFLFFCKRTASSSEVLLGGQINAGTTLSIHAGGEVLNDGGMVLGIGDTTIDAARIVARGRPVHTAIVRADGLKAVFGDTWARIYAADQGGGFTSLQGKLILKGAARQERGYFKAAAGIEGQIEVIELPQRDPVSIEDHLGIFHW